MKKITKSLWAILTLAACAGPAWKQNITPNTRYKINPVKVELNSFCPAPSFMTEPQLQQAFDNGIKKAFCARHKCTDKITPDTVVMDIFVEYHRTFMGEGFACNESYAGSDVMYSFDLSQNDTVFYHRPQTQPLAPARGFLGNMGRIATQLSFSGGPDQEKDDLNYLAPGIGKKIIEDLK